MYIIFHSPVLPASVTVLHLERGVPPSLFHDRLPRFMAYAEAFACAFSSSFALDSSICVLNSRPSASTYLRTFEVPLFSVSVFARARFVRVSRPWRVLGNTALPSALVRSVVSALIPRCALLLYARAKSGFFSRGTFYIGYEKFRIARFKNKHMM